MDTDSLSDVLAGLRRQKEAEKLASDFLQRLRQDAPFSSFEEDKWEEITSKILRDLPVPAPSLNHDSLSAITNDEAAAPLRDNILWKAVEKQVLIKEKSSRRSAVDLIIGTAIDVAQKEITRNLKVDLALGARHRLEAHNWRDPDGKAGSQIVLRRKIEIPSQRVSPELAFYGTLDLVLAVVPARNAKDALESDDTPYAATDFIHNLKSRLATVVIEANNADKPIESKNAQAEAATQGASLCVFTDRPSVVTVLTDGRKWQFSQVTRLKMPDLDSKPFKIAKTRMFDISRGQDIAIVIRLLTVAVSGILFAPLRCSWILMCCADAFACRAVWGVGSGGNVFLTSKVELDTFAYFLV
ncbi:hypothetical protein C8R45DRAFT_989302 [Mycena sanguinolenta]|nr:hypothetical protein C8R45DRAFT_989302 [Mycena sanguinolenta]